MKLTESSAVTEMKLFLAELAAFSEEQRTEIFREVHLTEVAYATPAAERTDGQRILVQQHESWKTKETK